MGRATVPGRLVGKQVLMVIAPEDFRDEEYLEPRKVFEGEGATVRVASTKVVKARGMLGATVNVGSNLEGLKVQDYDSIVVVGGQGSPSHLWGSAALHSALQEAAGAGRVVASICLSGAVLARAGLLNGKKATVFDGAGAVEELRKGGAKYVAEPVVRDGKVVTANGPEAARAFAETVVEAMTTP